MPKFSQKYADNNMSHGQLWVSMFHFFNLQVNTTHTIVDVIYRKINTKYVQNSKHIYNIIDSVDIAKGMPNFLPSTFLSIPLFVKTFPLEKIDLKFIDKITFIHDILCLSIIFAYLDTVLPKVIFYTRIIVLLFGGK